MLFFYQNWAYAEAMAHLQELITDWTDCSLVEVIPNKVSGVPLLKGTRLPADTILENYEGGSPVDEIAENFDVSEQAIREILDYAATHPRQPHP
jgi:uncharacterized protein (DUF433 family)